MTAPYAKHNQSIKIELIDEEEWYALTINPQDDYQYWNENTDTRLKMFTDNIKIVMHRILQPCRYELYVEVSPVGRLHLHGKMRFNNKSTIIRWYISQIHKLGKVSHFEIDTIEDMKIWDEYIKKQYHIFNIKLTSEDKISRLALLDVAAKVTYKKLPLEDQ